MTRAIARKGGNKLQPNQPVRLMIIDDSLVARTALKRIVEGGDGMEVLAELRRFENQPRLHRQAA